MPTPSFEELKQTVLDRCAGDDALERVRVAVAVAAELTEVADSLTNHFVEEARKSGASWSQIGDALGMSKQGAQQWVRRRVREAMPGRSRSLLDVLRSPMFARFTDRGRMAVKDAVEEARVLGHAYVGTEHLLLSILHQTGTVARRALARLSIDVDRLRDHAVEIAGPASPQVMRGRLPFTPRAKRVLELSLREALRLGHNYIGTEHITIALVVEGDGVAGRALAHAGIDADALRAAVLDELAA